MSLRRYYYVRFKEKNRQLIMTKSIQDALKPVSGHFPPDILPPVITPPFIVSVCNHACNRSSSSDRPNRTTLPATTPV